MDSDRLSRDVRAAFPGVVVTSRVDPETLERPSERPARQLPRAQADRDLVEAWADWLAPYFGQGAACNFTGTYSDAYGYPNGLMLPRNVRADFLRFRERVARDAESACIGIERAPQGLASGRTILHFHALLGGSWTPGDIQHAARLWEYSRGWAVAKLVTDRAGCVEYAAKHLLKQGAADNFDFWIAPKRWLSRQEKRALRALREATS